MKYTLAQIPVSLHLGVPDEERKTKQEILVDVRFEFDSTQAQTSDEFEGLIDYQAVYDAVQRFPGDHHFVTVEYLYRELLTHLQEKFPKAENLEIRIQKFPFEDGWVEVGE